MAKRIPRIVTLVLTVATILVLVLSVPDSLRDDYKRGNFYLFSHSFIEDMPRRMAGPGRFRLILQPLMAIFLGIRGGIVDARRGRPPFISGVLLSQGFRQELLKSGFRTLVNLLLMSVLLDSVFQWMIYGSSHPGAALVVGPVLIAVPYSVARALANRCARLRSNP
jgi:hypothetical protein